MTMLSKADFENCDMSDACFQQVVHLAKINWGLSLEEGKRPLVVARLRKRVRATGSRDFVDYVQRLSYGDIDECDHFISALTTNVTQFFRELHHFDFLEETVFPELKSSRNIRIWSAGCSTGQEPYSIATIAKKTFGRREDVQILATDADPEVLRFAKNGEFDVSDVHFPSVKHKRDLFEDSESSELRVRAALRNMIDFRRLNLVQPWPINCVFDVIFCRNVAIYFDKDTQDKLWAGFSSRLKSGGYLFIGHSERINFPENIKMEPVGITSYRKFLA
ncbi:protein-glutamate O-methyltransferase CheR [Donghicola sp. C2-DW-16]|uniref:Chemotaxis protein methyltransferase n=1 Tax=Donghicola mangrovi TaxID=2729614 RepID=A0ABX2PHD8_9RHOB|nr:protein-glutamate O-methyltransferase CheR [Donghicola mangrovi]NVO28514.1 protein-glutamate O-methyltransferase CheR [Donghicola mangrovi]